MKADQPRHLDWWFLLGAAMTSLPCSFVIGLPAGSVSSLAPSEIYLRVLLGISVAGGIGYSSPLYFCRAKPSRKLSAMLGALFGSVAIASIALGLDSSLNFGRLFLYAFGGSICIGVAAGWFNRRQASGAMDSRLAVLIGDYLSAVSSAVKLLDAAGIERPATNTAWACNGIPQMGFLADGVKYYKHGYGCAVHLKGGSVDFDFGENGELTGFDIWRLAGFANTRLGQYGFSSERELEACFKAEVEAGSIDYSGYILHYVHEESH